MFPSTAPLHPSGAGSASRGRGRAFSLRTLPLGPAFRRAPLPPRGAKARPAPRLPAWCGGEGQGRGHFRGAGGFPAATEGAEGRGSAFGGLFASVEDRAAVAQCLTFVYTLEKQKYVLGNGVTSAMYRRYFSSEKNLDLKQIRSTKLYTKFLCRCEFITAIKTKESLLNCHGTSEIPFPYPTKSPN